MVLQSSSSDSALFIGGTRITGQQVRDQNVTAALTIANIVRTSLGPVGLDKMLVDDIGDVTITNDGATILDKLEVEHSAGKILVELARQQDKEVGDGTTSVVLLAAELLKRGNELVKNRIHPTTVIGGYRLACREAVKYLREQLSTKVETIGHDGLVNLARTTLSSKILGLYEKHFAEIAVQALEAVKKTTEGGRVRYPVSSVSILQLKGGSADQSRLIHGVCLQRPLTSQAMKSKITGVKVACIDFDLTKTRMYLGVNIIVDDPENLDAIRQNEHDMTANKVKMLLAAGANVIMSTRGIDEAYAKMIMDAGAVSVARVPKDDLRRLASGSGATLLASLSNLEGEEVFDANNLGTAESFELQRIGDEEIVVIQGASDLRAATVILRGANDHMLEEMERSLHDALCALRSVLESGAVVAGGGAVESALSVYLEAFATTLGSREQLAVAEFATAILAIPKQLAINAAKDSIELLARLRAFHAASKIPKDDPRRAAIKGFGLDLTNGSLRNNLEAGVLEPTISKVKMIKAATEAAIAILRIDDLIKLNPEQPKDDPHGH